MNATSFPFLLFPPLFCQSSGLASESQIYFANTNESNKPTMQIHKGADTSTLKLYKDVFPLEFNYIF